MNLKPDFSQSPYMTLPEFLAYFRLTAKTAKVHVMFMARSGRIPGAKKINGKWLFDKRKADQWNEA